MNILHEILQEINTNGEKAKCENDFFLFCKTYLPHYFPNSSAEYQKVLIDIANKNAVTKTHIKKLQPFMKSEYHALVHECKNIKTIVDIEPRGFSKSTRWTFAYPLWRLLYSKNKFVCIFCASQEMANDAIQKIKTEIESNDKILDDFGDLAGESWKANFLTFANGTAIKGFGAGSAVRGAKYKQHRPDLVICDDILKDEAARTHAQREKIYSWFLRAVLPLGQDIFTIIVNTIFHNDDLPSRLLKRIEKKELPDWIGFRFQAFTPEGESLWAEYWSKEKLLDKKRELGSVAFACEYMNEALSEEEQVFKSSWFRKYTNAPNDLRIYQGIDPSAGKHDQFAIVTIGVDTGGTIYMLDEWAETVSVEKATQKVIEKYICYQPLMIAFESVGFQTIYKQYILENASRKGIYLPIKEMSTKGIGKERILALSPLIENGQLLFKENENKTIEQLTQYPKSEFDDLADALFYAFEISKQKQRGVFAFGL